jgi:Phospholipase A2
MMKISKTFPRRAVVHVAKPKKEAKRTVEKGSKRKESGGKKIESPAGSGSGVAEVRKPANDLKPNGGASTISALYPVVENSIPVASELAKTLGLPEDQNTPQQLSFPVYGNYCGFGHGDPTGSTPPIDAVDAVCRQHDLCYRLLGDFDCQCDRHFIESMPSAIASTPSPIGKHAGFLALLYFSLAERNLALGETLVKRT